MNRRGTEKTEEARPRKRRTTRECEQKGIQGSEGRKGLAQWFALEARSPEVAWNGGALRKPEAMHPGCLGHPARDASI